LSSDFIVGFPGETEADFRETLSLIDEVGFAGAYSFIFSPRPGTPAATMDGQITAEEKSERLQRLQKLITRQQRAFNASFAGRSLDVLLEKPGRLRQDRRRLAVFFQALKRKGAECLRHPVVAALAIKLEHTAVGQVGDRQGERRRIQAGAGGDLARGGGRERTGEH